LGGMTQGTKDQLGVKTQKKKKKGAPDIVLCTGTFEKKNTNPCGDCPGAKARGLDSGRKVLGVFPTQKWGGARKRGSGKRQCKKLLQGN